MHPIYVFVNKWIYECCFCLGGVNLLSQTGNLIYNLFGSILEPDTLLITVILPTGALQVGLGPKEIEKAAY